ncbi:MAG: hypothetical protein COV52_04370 [Gammaproteobacteria bacterium CG11_big_fil_rev_8_21_14_0_20_46_22]|nr:MAG: hypothetical protein COV52_04370 [Gammaproteobacteria bacterium CG11_big_fil_rev_8_21_14_0_20_46_22]
MKEKIEKLRLWSEENKIDEANLARVFSMLERGRRADRGLNDPVQFPACYLEDDKASAWHEAGQYPWVKLLEENYEAIKAEALKVFQENKMAVHPENDDLAGDGTWNTFFFYKNGEKYEDNIERCPVTAKLLEQIPGVEIAGRTYFSAMTPGIHIKPHCGPHNFKLRTHLGLITPSEAVIRVSDEIKSWKAGECLVFDDSFEHEVWNKSELTRIVLIVDVWNPILSLVERAALRYIMPEFYQG